MSAKIFSITQHIDKERKEQNDHCQIQTKNSCQFMYFRQTWLIILQNKWERHIKEINRISKAAGGNPDACNPYIVKDKGRSRMQILITVSFILTMQGNILMVISIFRERREVQQNNLGDKCVV